jgi:hypothetical protein
MSKRYVVIPAEKPRYGHEYDIIDTHMELPENRIHCEAVDSAHAAQLASSLNYWHEVRQAEGKAAANAHV